MLNLPLSKMINKKVNYNFLMILIFCFVLSTLSCFTKYEDLEFSRSIIEVRNDTSETLSRSIAQDAYKFYNKKDTTFSVFFDNANFDLYISSFYHPKRNPQIINFDTNLFEIDNYGLISSTSIDKSKVAFVQQKRFGVYDLNTKKIVYQHPIDGHDSLKIYFVDNPIPIHYVDSLNEIYITVVHWINLEDRTYDFDYRFLAKINCNTNKLSLFPIKYPKSFGNGELGLSGLEHILYKGDSIIYSFSSEEDVIIYNKSSNAISKKKAKSKHQRQIKKANSTDPNFQDINVDLSKTNFTYDYLLYDKWKKCYYRTYSLSQNLKNSDGTFNSFQDKRKGVLVLNEHFDYLGEFILPEPGIHRFGVSMNGIFYRSPHQTNKNFREYITLNVEL